MRIIRIMLKHMQCTERFIRSDWSQSEHSDGPITPAVSGTAAQGTIARKRYGVRLTARLGTVYPLFCFWYSLSNANSQYFVPA